MVVKHRVFIYVTNKKLIYKNFYIFIYVYLYVVLKPSSFRHMRVSLLYLLPTFWLLKPT